MRWLTNFYDFRFKGKAKAAIGIHPTKAWLSQLVIFKNCNEYTLEEGYAIKLCFNLGKMHQFLSGIRDWRKPGSLWGMMRGVEWARKSEQQSWLAKGLELGLGLLCRGFNGVPEEIRSEESSTLQIGSVAFPADYLTKMGIKTVPQPPYSPDVAPCDIWLFPKLRGCRYETIEEMKEAVTKVIDMLT